MPTKVGTVNIGKDIAGTTSAMVPTSVLDSVVSIDGMSGGAYQEGFSRWGMMNQNNGSGFYSSRESGVFDSMALPDHFLRQYYSQVRSIIPKNLFKKLVS